MGEIWEEFEAIDREVEKHQKKLIESVDFYCALYQANQEILKQEILKQEKLKKAGPKGVFYNPKLKSRIEKSLSKNKKRACKPNKWVQAYLKIKGVI